MEAYSAKDKNNDEDSHKARAVGRASAEVDTMRVAPGVSEEIANGGGLCCRCGGWRGRGEQLKEVARRVCMQTEVVKDRAIAEGDLARAQSQGELATTEGVCMRSTAHDEATIAAALSRSAARWSTVLSLCAMRGSAVMVR